MVPQYTLFKTKSVLSQWHLVYSQNNNEIEGDSQNDNEVWGKQSKIIGTHNFF